MSTSSPSQRGTLILVVGPSGAGKDTLIDGARAWFDGDQRFKFARRDITRPAEAGGEDHNPLDLTTFLQAQERGRYALSWGAHDLHYGIPSDIELDLANGQSVIANVSRSVIDKAREFDPTAVISITVSESILRKRLVARGRESTQDIERRVARANSISVRGSNVTDVPNESSVEEGQALFVQALAEAHGACWGTKPESEIFWPRKGAYGIAIQGDEVLLVERISRRTGERTIVLPGGGLENDENHLDALAREMREETGYDLVGMPSHIRDLSHFHKPTQNSNEEKHSSGLRNWHKINRYYDCQVEKVGTPTDSNHVPFWAQIEEAKALLPGPLADLLIRRMRSA